MTDKKIGKYAGIGAGLGITSWVASQVYKWAGVGTSGIQSSLEFAPIAEGVKSSIQSGISTDLASNLIGLLNGVIAGGVMGFLTLIVAGILVGIAGGYIVDFLTSYKPLKRLGEGIIIRLVSIAVTGTIAIGLIVSAFAGTPELPVLNAVLSMVLYFTVVGFLYGLLANWTQKTMFKQFFPNPM